MCLFAVFACDDYDGSLGNYSSGDAPEPETDPVLSGEENIKFIDDNFGGTLEMIDADETKAAYTALYTILDKERRENSDYQVELSGTGAPLVFEGEKLGHLDLWEHTDFAAYKDGEKVVSAKLELAIMDNKYYFDFTNGAASASGTVWFGKQTVTFGRVALLRRKQLLRKEFEFLASDISLFVEGTQSPIIKGYGSAVGDIAWEYSLPEKAELHMERPGVISTDASYTDLLANKHSIVINYNGKPRVRAIVHFNHIMRSILSYVAPSQLSFLTDSGGDDGLGYMAFSDENWLERALEDTYTEDNFPRSFAAVRRFL